MSADLRTVCSCGHLAYVHAERQKRSTNGVTRAGACLAEVPDGFGPGGNLLKRRCPCIREQEPAPVQGA